MRVIAISQYGGPDQLTSMERPKPTCSPADVLIRVGAASVNPLDWKIRAGYLAAYFPAQFPLVLGVDVAGTVEAVGDDVTDFAPGDEVYGMVLGSGGTYAEYVAAPAAIVAHKPASLDLTQAAAVPLVGLTAHAAIAGALNIQAGETVLIGGAAGGVGAVAAQLAIARGAQVIGIASAPNHDYVRSLGAQAVIDYQTRDVAMSVRTTHPDGVDAALDVAGGDSLSGLADTLRQGGRIATLSGDGATLARLQERGLATHSIYGAASAAALAELARMIDAGRLSVRVAEVVPLAEAARAQQLVESGRARGKVVLSVA